MNHAPSLSCQEVSVRSQADASGATRARSPIVRPLLLGYPRPRRSTAAGAATAGGGADARRWPGRGQAAGEEGASRAARQHRVRATRHARAGG